MEANGISFYEGCSISVDAKSRTLRMTNTEEQFDLVGVLWDSEPTFFQRARWWIQSWIPRPSKVAPPPATKGEIEISAGPEAIPGLEPLPGVEVNVRYVTPKPNPAEPD
jgi:hypothetical protein